MFFGTLLLPPWRQWWSGFSAWYGAQGEPPKAYLRCLIHYFAETFSSPGTGLDGSEGSADAAASGAASQRDVHGGSEDCGADPALKRGPGLHPSARREAGRGLPPSGGIQVEFCRRVLQQKPDWAASTQLLLPARVTGAAGQQLQRCARCRQYERAAAGLSGAGAGRQAGRQAGLVEEPLATGGPQQHAVPFSLEAVCQHQPLAGVSPREPLCERQLLGLDGAATGRRQRHITSASMEAVCQHQPLTGVLPREVLCEWQLLGLDGAAAVVFANREVSFGPAGTQEEQVSSAERKG